MMKHTILILFLFLSLLCHGQSYKFFTTDRELSSSLINKIYQDRNGMIWIATEDGLNRYDGAKFITYKHDPENEYSLCHNYVRVLYEDSKGRLFVGTYNGIQLYDPETDSFSARAQWEDGKTFDSNIMSILERRNGEIWVSGNNLCTITITQGKLTAHKLDLPIPTQMTDYMIEDRQHNLWVTQGENGIYRLSADNKSKHFLKQEKGMTIVDLYEDNYGDIYLATIGKGLLKYNQPAEEFIPILYKGKQNLPIKSICQISQNELCLGTDGKGTKIFNIPKQLITDYPFDNNYLDSGTSKVHSVLKDNAGNLWIAIYQKGVMMIPAQPNSFKYIGYKSINKNIIGSNCITSLCRDHEGILWIGTDNDGIYGITTELKQKVHYAPHDSPSSVPSTVFGLYEDSEHNLWFGSYTNGLGRLDKKTGQCSYLQNLTDKNGNRIQRVYDLVEDQDKRLWIATMGAGLFYYDLKTGQSVYDPKFNAATKKYKWISCLLYAGDNHLYVGTYDGIRCIDLSTDDFKTEEILSRHIIHSLYEDPQGNIWIGNSEGLAEWNPQTQQLKTYTTAHGLSSNAVYAIKGDGQDNLWISTNAGMSRFNLNTHTFSNFYADDGLQGNEFSKNASFADHNGILWFGGTNGITYFNPQEITNPAKKWNVRIIDFYLHDQPIRKGMLSGGKEIINTSVFEARDFHLSHNDNAFSIEFSTRELNNSERITYLYTINNTPWVKLPKGVNRVSFSDLPPGDYHFRIKAEDYLLESDTDEITIHIAPAWWASGWAMLIYALLAVAAVYGIILQMRHRYRIRQEMMQHIHAEQINEAKLQFFINISHEIRTPMSLIISPLQKLMTNDTDHERQKNYRIIWRNSERILRLVNQLMDIRKIDKGQMSLVFRETEMTGFINDLCETFTEQANKKQITLQFHHEGADHLKLWVDPVNFDKIILNILSNAFKFTPEGGSVDIRLRTGKDSTLPKPLQQYAEITVTDSGIGIAPKETEHIFERFYQIRNSQNNSNIGTGIGLHLTRSLVELHHGDIRVENNPDGQPGCSFIIRMPLGCAHLRKEEMEADKAPLFHTPAPVLPVPYETEEEENGKTRTKTKYKVLVVEDDEDIRRYICRELASDYHTLESCNGKEALESIFNKTPDLVISDVMMPEMDGLTLCRKIKQNVNLNHIPVILLTAKTREEDNLEGLETGADAYMTKPFHIEILRKTTANLIRSRERLRNTYTGQQTQGDKIQPIEVQSPDDKLMERIIRVINENLSNPNLTVEMITTEVGISRVHLHRKLKELTNQTTRDFIRNIRLKQAAELLSKKRYTIAEVADLTGFTNPNNFSTAFKDLYGMPPSMYMEQHLKQDKNKEEAVSK